MPGVLMNSKDKSDTKPEMLVRKFLHANDYRYKLNDKTLPGKPGIVFIKIQNNNFYTINKISLDKFMK